MSSTRRSRRVATNESPLGIGAANEDDEPARRRETTSSASISTREIPGTNVPSLSKLCAQVASKQFRLIGREETWNTTKHRLDRLPDPILKMLFAMLRMDCPTVLNHALLCQHFLRGSSITLTHSLPGVIKPTIRAIGRMGGDLRDLSLLGFDKFLDADFASVIRACSKIRNLNLRGCTKVAGQTMQALGECCWDLLGLNVSYTSVTPLSLSSIIQNCRGLQTLKAAGVENWTDVAFGKLMAALGSDLHLPNLTSLKFRYSSLTEVAVTPLLRVCPNLRRLDLGFTGLRHAHIQEDIPTQALEKLVLASTQIPGPELTAAIRSLPTLKILHLDAMGGGQGTAARMGNSTAMTLSDPLLEDITGALDGAINLEVVSLIGNTKLGLTRRQGLWDFISRVGRRCKRLHLSGIRNIKSSDLAGLTPDDGQPPSSLQVLALDNTNVGDEAIPFLATCHSLHTLNVAGTKFTSLTLLDLPSLPIFICSLGEGLFDLIDSCLWLEQLDLTGCRGVKLADRRRFFEVWSETRSQDG